MTHKFYFTPLDRLPDSVTINGFELTMDQIIAVARKQAKVFLDVKAKRRVGCCRKVVEILLERREVVYGLTTGLGKLRDIIISPEDVSTLQMNMIRSHAAGVGDPLPEDVVRAAILLRANTLARGNSGVRVEIIQCLLYILNDGIYPFIPSKGSVGASGDLAPLSHLALLVIGDPEAKIFNPLSVKERRKIGYVSTPSIDDFIAWPNDALEIEKITEEFGWSFKPCVLEAKEGLALTNGTQIMTAMAALACYDTFYLLRTAEAAAALSLEGQRAVAFAFRPEIHEARPLEHQGEVAKRILGYLDGSQIIELYINSAYLNRAVRRLKDAEELLFRKQTDMGGPEAEGVMPLVRVGKRISEHAHQIAEILKDAVSHYQSISKSIENKCGSFDTDVRRQLVEFKSIIQPIRMAVAHTYQDIQSPAFPNIPEISSLLAETLRDLDRAVPSAPPIQDDYSFRCIPQVAACAYRCLDHTSHIVAVEINSATDNPLLFPPQPEGGLDNMEPEEYLRWIKKEPSRIAACAANVLGGGNFHGEPIAVIMDYLAICLAEIANISERRIAHLVDETVSNGLPGFLTESTGLNSGFMIPQYTAAA